MTAPRGIILHLQLYGRVKISEGAIDDAVLCSKEGVDDIIEAIYKIGFPFIGNAVYLNYIVLTSIQQSSNETCANYEDRFSAAFTKLFFNDESRSTLGHLQQGR